VNGTDLGSCHTAVCGIGCVEHLGL